MKRPGKAEKSRWTAKHVSPSLLTTSNALVNLRKGDQQPASLISELLDLGQSEDHVRCLEAGTTLRYNDKTLAFRQEFECKIVRP